MQILTYGKINIASHSTGWMDGKAHRHTIHSMPQCVPVSCIFPFPFYQCCDQLNDGSGCEVRALNLRYITLSLDGACSTLDKFKVHSSAPVANFGQLVTGYSARRAHQIHRVYIRIHFHFVFGRFYVSTWNDPDDTIAFPQKKAFWYSLSIRLRWFHSIFQSAAEWMLR